MNKILDLYHLKALNISKMDGYESTNYLIETAEGYRVIKHYKDPKGFPVLRAEIKLLNELASRLPFQIPCSIVPSQELSDGSLTRLYKYIEGDILGKAKQNKKLLDNFGQAIGLLSRELAGKRDPTIEARKLRWDQQHCLINRPKVRHIRSVTHRRWVNYFMDQFAEHVAPIQHTLRHSIIHGDLNEQNVIVEKNKIAGIIDFDDICFSPLVNEISIAMAYSSLTNKREPLGMIEGILKAYHAIFPLLPEEVDLLYYLIPIRLCVSVANSSEAQANGTDTEYIVKNQEDAWDVLEKWLAYDTSVVSNRFRMLLGIDQT